MNSSFSQALAPDFYHFEPSLLVTAAIEGHFVYVRWSDDTKLVSHRFWLRENVMGQGGIDLTTREGILDPAELTNEIEVKHF